MKTRRQRWKALLERFQAIRGQFNTAMLITRGADGAFRGRPMAIVGSDSAGDLWFVSSLDSGKVDEIVLDDRVTVSMQRGDSTFLSVSGRARVSRERRLVEALWNNDRSGWLRQGRPGPREVAIQVIVEEVEYWSSPPLRRLSSAVSRLAVGDGRPPDGDVGLHGKFMLV
jgi:general stress protein 26